MEKIITHVIPSFFSAYSITLAENCGMLDPKSDIRIRKIQYHCRCCGQDFTVFHRYIQRLGYYGYGEELVACPNCGEAHRYYTRQKTIFSFVRKIIDSKDPQNEPEGVPYVAPDAAPINATLTLTRIKDGIILKVFGKVISMVPDDEKGLAIVRQENRSEEFRFDVKHRRTTFSILRPVWNTAGGHTHIIKSYELGDPFDRRIYKDSILMHLESKNLSKPYLKEAKLVLKALRDGVRKMWKEIHSYDIGSLFVSSGTANGILLFPIMNLAFRMVYSDAGNLPKELNGTDTEADVFKSSRMLIDYGSELDEYGDLDFVRQQPNSLDAVIRKFGLPDKTAIRKELTRDIFRAPELRAAFHVTDNLDQALRVYICLNAITYRRQLDQYYYPSSFDRRGVYGFLQKLAKYYSVEKIIHLLQVMAKSYGYAYLRDIQRLFEELASKYRSGISKVKPKHLHDWLVERVNAQEVQGFELEVPEHVVRRLKLQLDNGMAKFYLPHNSKELDQASQIFHNCVRTYKARVKTQQCNIVFMTDDDGSLTACLEIRDNALVQAKLRYNKPVCDDGAVNGAVIDWCRKAKLRISTSDVREMQYPAVIEEKKVAV